MCVCVCACVCMCVCLCVHACVCVCVCTYSVCVWAMEDPVRPKKGETDECYHGLLRMMLESVEERRMQVMVATHNEETVQNAIQM